MLFGLGGDAVLAFMDFEFVPLNTLKCCCFPRCLISHTFVCPMFMCCVQAVDPNLAKLAEIAEQAGMATETMDVDNSDAEDAHGDARTAANDGADDNEDDLSEDEIERRDMADFNSDGGSSKSKPPRKRAATPAFKGRAGSANGTPKSQKSNKKNARMHTSE